MNDGWVVARLPVRYVIDFPNKSPGPDWEPFAVTGIDLTGFVWYKKSLDTCPPTAYEWVERNIKLLDKFAGRWVAVTSRGMVAESDDFETVYREAKAKRVDDPLVFKVPKAPEVEFRHKISTPKEAT